MSQEREVPLMTRLIGDFTAGIGTGLALSPFITPMDAAITENMSGKRSIPGSLSDSFKTMLTRPHQYIRRPEFGVIFGVYSMTYLAKNSIDSLCLHYNKSNEETAFWKFWGVLAVNGSLCIFWRDPQFAKIFGTKAPSAVPVISYSLWLSRDVFHMLGSVVAPDYLEKRYQLTPEQWRYAQVSFPLLIQFITTPCHLMGLDFYNNKDSAFGLRVARTAKQLLPSVGVRMIRMFPPWSIGLVVNRSLRDYFLEKDAESN